MSDKITKMYLFQKTFETTNAEKRKKRKIVRMMDGVLGSSKTN